MNDSADPVHRPADAAPTRRESWLAGQNQAFKAAVNGAPLEQSLEILISTAIDQVEGTSRCAFYILNEDGTDLTHLLGMPESYAEKVRGLKLGPDTLAVGVAEPVITPDVREEPRWKPWLWLAEEYGYRGSWSFPVETAGRKLIGTFAMYFPDPRTPTPQDLEFARSLAATASIIITQHRNLADLRSSEEQLRLIVESARDYAIFTIDEHNVIDRWLAGAANVFGWSREEAEGQSGEILYTPEDRATGQPEQEIATARRDGKAPDVRWHQHKDGRRVFIEGQVVPLRDYRNEITGFLKIGQDVTERKFREDALRESEERFRQFGEFSSDLLWIRDGESLAFEYLSPAFEKLYGVPREEVLARNNVEAWLELIHPDDRNTAVDVLRQTRGGAPTNKEFRIVRPDGEVRWVHNTDFPMLDEFGKVQRIAGIAQDVTGRKKALELQRTLVAELQHRVRNILAITRSIMRRTLVGKSDLTDFAQHLEGRMDALARTQALLTRVPGSAVDLEEIIRDEMLAHATREPKYSLSGPRIRLQPQAAEVLTLAMHELATNSVKYGALATDRGKIRIKWSKERQHGQEWLKLRWSETGIDVPNQKPREGFGTELITRRVPYELGGRGELKFNDAGVAAAIEFPLKQADSILQPGAARLQEAVE